MAMINLTPSGGDDQPQIQAAVNSLLASGGAVRLAAGNWVLKSTLVIGSDAAPSSVALIGEGPLATHISYYGTGPNAIQVNRQKYSRLEGFSLTGTAKPDQSGIAFVSGAPSVHGTTSNGGTLEQVGVSKFGWGLSVGQGQWQASEWAFRRIAVSRCNIGMSFNGYNTLNFELEQPEISDCQLGIQASGSSIAMRGGAFANNGAVGCGLGWDKNGGDVLLRTGKFAFSNVRSEGCKGTPWAFQSTDATMDACVAQAVSGAQAVFHHAGTSLVCNTCYFAGRILCKPQGDVGILVMHGCDVMDNVPFQLLGRGDSLHYSLIGCRKYYPSVAPRSFFSPASRAGYCDAAGVMHDAWSCP